MISWLIRETSNSEESITEIPLSVSTDCTHEEASNKIKDLKGLPQNVEKWIRLKDKRKKLKLLQRAQHIYACRDKTEDKERVFNFGILTSLKSEFCEQEQGSERGTDPRYLFLWKTITIIKLVQTVFFVIRECRMLSSTLQKINCP